MFTWLLLMRKEFGAHEKPRTPAEPGPSGRLSAAPCSSSNLNFTSALIIKNIQ